MTHLKPLRHWLTVMRDETGRRSNTLYTPQEDLREACVGNVVAIGTGIAKRGKVRPHDCRPGERIVYSSRIDRYRVGDTLLDVIEEGSVIGKLKP